MQAAPARYVSSSELYSADEVELLLEEIRELEPVSCRGEEVQDFEIAGSGCGAGGRSPAGTELTERSWDSHAHYSRAPPPTPRPLAPVYCRLRHLMTVQGAFTLLVVACCASACGCVWAGAGLRAGQLPGGGRVRLLHLAALSSLMLHALLLLLHVTRLTELLPLDWNKLGGCAGAWSALTLAGGGAATLHAALQPAYRPAPHLARLLLAAAGLGLSGACLAAALTVRAVRRARAGCVVGAVGAAGAGGSRRSSGRSSPRAAYRAVPQPQPQPQPSTSRDHAL
ncbi:uncharacterized protein LOC106715707 [Papilio machaon]|uniref:uncharacterized protein LOC106715707 n=1 Tax=Papilio machaon TaxID=76193 RepID=UPI001E662BC3|nr:uncharacterized protein LOC106715707 [Papilio machaon]